MSAAVVFEGVSFAYPDAPEPALRDVSFELAEGSFALVTGPTGSGKSTLVRAMNGLVPHFTGGSFSGRVRVGGRDTIERPPRYLADVVAFVPQQPDAAFVVDRVEDELAYGMENLGIAPAVMRRRVEETLDLMNIEGLRDRSVRSLSGGERQRVAIAAALGTGPRVLLLDEPTSQLDPQGAEDVLAALQRLVDDLGLTVVVAEHRLERVAGFVDVALGCAGGGRVLAGRPPAVLDAVGTGPPVFRLGRLLGWSPPPLTVREARRYASGVALDSSRAPRAGGETGADRLLVVSDLAAHHDGRRALEGVSLTLSRGEVVALMGRNGAGKTTLLRCFAGVHQPSAGIVSAAGRAPRPGPDAGLCPQDPDSILYRDRVVDEVRTSLSAAGRDEDPAELLDRLGIADLAEAHPRDLSAGERVLVAAAATAATGAPLLLLDEPTRGLDVESKARLAALLRRHVEGGGAAVVATHDVELAAEIATRVVLLAAGRVVAEGAPSEVLADSAVFSPQTARVFGPPWLTPEMAVAGAAPRLEPEPGRR